MRVAAQRKQRQGSRGLALERRRRQRLQLVWHDLTARVEHAHITQIGVYHLTVDFERNRNAVGRGAGGRRDRHAVGEVLRRRLRRVGGAGRGGQQQTQKRSRAPAHVACFAAGGSGEK